MANSLPTYKNDKLLREIQNDNENSYEKKIVQTAIELAISENAKYKTWYVLKTIPKVSPPYDLIDQYAKKIYTGNDGFDDYKRREWRETTLKQWQQSFDREIDQSYYDELHIRKTIDYHTDDYASEFSESDLTKLDQKIVKKIIATFETPENAAADHNDQTLNDLIQGELPNNP